MKANDSSDAENVQAAPPYHQGVCVMQGNADISDRDRWLHYISSEKSVPYAIYSQACSETGDAQIFHIKNSCILNIKIICEVFFFFTVIYLSIYLFK